MLYKKQIILAVIAVVLIVIVGFYSKPKVLGTINVGVIAPLTGIRAEGGEFMKNGLSLAEQSINKDKSKKYKINLIYEDSRYEPQVAVSSFLKLKNVDKVNYVLGPNGSSEVLAVAPLAEKDKTILITPAAQSEKISESGDYIFRIMHTSSQDAPVFAKYISTVATSSPIHVIGINTDITDTYVNSLKKALEGYGGKIGAVEKFDPKEVDFKTVLLKIKAKNPKYLLLIGSMKQEGLIIKQANDLGIKLKFFGFGTEGPEIFETAGNLVDGLVYPYSYDSSSTDRDVAGFRNLYQERYGKEPDTISANSYDSLMILSNCFEKVGDKVDSVKDCLYGIKNYHGASGSIEVDKNGDAIKNIIIKTIKDGKFVKLE